MADATPIALGKFIRISPINRGEQNSQVIIMQIKPGETISADDKSQIEKFCQEKLNNDAQINLLDSGSTIMISINGFTESDLQNLIRSIKK